MKYFIVLLLCLFAYQLNAQAPPQGFNYSSVIRDSNKQAIPNTYVSVRLTIISTAPNGSIAYREVHSDTTNKFGVLNLVIGQGTPNLGDFSAIDWGADSYYLRTELDENGGNDFEIMGASQFMSVPYAMHSGPSRNDLEDNDTSSTNELQVLSISNDTIFLSDGGFVKLPVSFSGTNTDNQTLSYHNDTITISNGNSIAVPNLSSGATLGKKVGYGNVATGSIPNGWRPVPYQASSDTLELSINVNDLNETFIVYAGYSLTNIGSTSAGSKSAIWVYNSYGLKVRDQIIAVQHHSNGQMIASCSGSVVFTDLPPGQYTVRVMHNLIDASSPGNLYYDSTRYLLVRKL